MRASLYHTHLFCSDIDATITWWTGMLGAEPAWNGAMAGARNVFLKIGDGRLHLYDQAPRDSGRGAVHHLGVRVDGLADLVAAMRAKGVAFRSEIREFEGWRYIMCAAPDGVLLELFEADADLDPPELADYLRA